MLLLPLGGTKKLEAGESSLWKKGLEDPIYTGRGKARGGWEGIRHEDSPMGLGLSVPPEQVWGGTTFIPILISISQEVKIGIIPLVWRRCCLFFPAYIFSLFKIILFYFIKLTWVTLVNGVI